MSRTGAIVAATACLVVYKVIQHFNSRPALPLPPGPPADPFIGHLRKFPTNTPETVFHEWAKQFGDVIHLDVLGRSIIVLDSYQAAVDLLEKRSALYSDRPRVLIFEIMGWYPDVVILPYGDRFRKHRKLLHSYLLPKSIAQFEPVLQENACTLVHGLMENKGNHLHLLGRYTTAIPIRIAYGHQIVDDDDEYVSMVETMGAAVTQIRLPGATPVDAFPVLQYFPSWFPGTHDANIARQWRWAVRRMYDIPYDAVKRQLAEGTAKPSLLSKLLEETIGESPSPEDVDDMKGVAAILYAAGAETTLTALSTFLLAMLIHPECQTLAQEEVDRVIGSGRLPTFADRGSLPYVDAVIEEVFRWNPITPLGIPHRSTHDDIYRGMFIPKGSFIMFNLKGMSLDEAAYADPTTFNPTRFLPKAQGGGGEPPFSTSLFGFGRRF
ncbi:hypothetical protein ONZ45_g2492 [Pleurotus djamor]|nr:hypothetical protein ONZ45_g2492 [Pleurotus djamor]